MSVGDFYFNLGFVLVVLVLPFWGIKRLAEHFERKEQRTGKRAKHWTNDQL